ncbi:MAG: hypothetical protein MO852_03630 [Candidatus Devosia euplotis]|nr:hypothetical protein [Candidatus Devosia euplotis]
MSATWGRELAHGGAHDGNVLLEVGYRRNSRPRVQPCQVLTRLLRGQKWQSQHALTHQRSDFGFTVNEGDHQIGGKSGIEFRARLAQTIEHHQPHGIVQP